MTLQKYYSLVKQKFGNIKRARQNYFYTQKGDRLLDLYKENGRAILGWGGSNAFTQFKNVMNRGTTGSFFTSFDGQLKKSVCKILKGDFEIFFFNDEAILKNLDAKKFIPFDDKNLAGENFVILQNISCWTNNFIILAAKKDAHINEEILEKQIFVNGAEKAALCRSFYNLIEKTAALCKKDFFIWDTVLTKYFVRKGPYLEPKIPENKYDDFVLHCMNLKILINPSYGKSIVPFGCEQSALKALKNSPFDWS